MESTRLLKSSLILIFTIISATLLLWYSNINSIEYKMESNEKELTEAQAIAIITEYSDSKSYFTKEPEFVKIERTNIPFKYKKTVLKKYKKQYLSS